MATTYPPTKDDSTSLPVGGTNTVAGSISVSNNALRGAIIALETKVGVSSSTDVTSLDYLVRNAGGVPTFLKIKPTDQTITSSTTLTPDTALLFPLAANEVWTATGSLYPDTNNLAGGDIKFGLTVPAGASVAWGPENFFTSAPTQLLTASGTSAITLGTAAKDKFGISYRYRIVNGATAGNFVLTWAQVSSNANASYLRAWSTLIAVRISP